GQHAGLTQSGDGNYLTLSQTGARNTVKHEQIGDFNAAWLEQRDEAGSRIANTQTALGTSLPMMINDIGNVQHFGEGNVAQVTQEGAANFAFTLQEAVIDSRAAVVQRGTGNSASEVTQIGSTGVTGRISQTGEFNAGGIQQFGETASRAALV